MPIGLVTAIIVQPNERKQSLGSENIDTETRNARKNFPCLRGE